MIITDLDGNQIDVNQITVKDLHTISLLPDADNQRFDAVDKILNIPDTDLINKLYIILSSKKAVKEPLVCRYKEANINIYITDTILDRFKNHFRYKEITHHGQHFRIEFPKTINYKNSKSDFELFSHFIDDKIQTVLPINHIREFIDNIKIHGDIICLEQSNDVFSENEEMWLNLLNPGFYEMVYSNFFINRKSLVEQDYLFLTKVGLPFEYYYQCSLADLRAIQDLFVKDKEKEKQEMDKIKSKSKITKPPMPSIPKH